MGVFGQRHAPAALPPERPGTHCIGGWVDLRAGLDGCGNSRPLAGIRTPDRPARSESLYGLSYPGSQYSMLVAHLNHTLVSVTCYVV